MSKATTPVLTPTSEPLTVDELAAAVNCTTNMVRHRLHSLPLAAYARKEGGRWLIRRDALADPAVWENLTGTANRWVWSPQWKGDRLGPRARKRLAKAEARNGGPIPKISAKDLPVVH